MADDCDVDEKKRFQNSRFFSLYVLQTQKAEQSESEDSVSIKSIESSGFSLVLQTTNLPGDIERDVRKFLFTKLAKGSIYSDTGCISVVENSNEERKELSCYFRELRQPDKNIINIGQGDTSSNLLDKYIVCFLSSSDNMLDHFRLDLDEYAAGLLRVLEQKDEAQINNYLQNWSKEATEYVCRCVSLVQQNVKYLINAALVDAKLEVKGGTDEIRKDVQRFVKACNLSDILKQMDNQGRESSPMSGSVDMLIDLVDTEVEGTKTVITMVIDENSVRFSPEVCTSFCEDWGVLVCKSNLESPGQVRQVVEAGKAKYIQSINTVKRLLIQAENDFYALYRAYVFLKKSGNCDVLLHSAHLDKIPEVCNVLKCLEEFIQENDIKK